MSRGNKATVYRLSMGFMKPKHVTKIDNANVITIDHFTVSCLVAWPLNESEAGGDLVLIETSQLLSC